MMPDPLFSQLLLVGLVWLCLMLHVVWPSDRATSGPTTPRPAKAPPKHSSDLKPFPGLTRQPPCAACAQAHESGPQPPGCPPPRIVPTRGRPRQVDTSWHFCPHPTCAYRGWVGLGNLSANGHPNGGPWRQLHCTSCGGYFQETHGTPLHGKRVASEKLVWAVGALAEGLGIRAVKTGEVSEAVAITRLSRSPHWVWAAIDPVTKLLLTTDVGDRTLAMAQHVVHQVVQVLAPGCVPLFLTDGFKEYTTALLTHYGQWVQPARQRTQGPAPKPRWMPLPQLLYAQVIKTVRRRRLVDVKHRIVFGTLGAVQQVLAAHSWQMNTAFIERLNLTIRQHVAAVGRRVSTLCKGEDSIQQQLALYHVYYNFCLPHASLRQLLPQPLPTHGAGSAKRWQPRTPAMAAGLTDRVWTLREILLCRVPPWRQPAQV